MTGYRSQHFRHICDDRGCYINALPSWDDIIGCFPRGIRPTDIDGMVEINDSVLILEEKPTHKTLDEGQRRALVALSRRDGVTVVFWRPGLTTDLDVLILGAGEPTGWQPCQRDDLLTWIRDWVAQVSLPDTDIRCPHHSPTGQCLDHQGHLGDHQYPQETSV